MDLIPTKRISESDLFDYIVDLVGKHAEALDQKDGFLDAFEQSIANIKFELDQVGSRECDLYIKGMKEKTPEAGLASHELQEMRILLAHFCNVRETIRLQPFSTGRPGEKEVFVSDDETSRELMIHLGFHAVEAERFDEFKSLAKAHGWGIFIKNSWV